LVDRLDPRVVILEFPFYPFAAGPLRSAGRTIVADIADDRIAVAHEVVHGSRSRKVRWRWRLDAPALGRSERAIELLDQVWFAAERDARAASRDHPGLDVRTIPNIVDVDHLAGIGASATPTSRSAAFIGAYDYAPNENAGLRFAERIAPRLKSNSEAGRLALVGRAPTARIRAAASAAGIELLADVADSATTLAGFSVMVAPMEGGSGTSLKLLEAAALGVPIVSTRPGVAGLDLVDGRDILIAETDGAIAEAIDSLWADSQLAGRLRASAQATVRARYGPAALESALRAALPEISTS
jgi:glycosyltransferase involved in cell wall biosynthesis